MEKRIYNKEQFHTGKWSGGTTTEFAIFPDKAEYLERDFIWRLSSACVATEESSFTKLPDYDRVLMVLEGETVLVHGEERTVKLTAFEQDSFGGDVKTKCFGKMTDYNLMVKKGCHGRLQSMELQSTARLVEKDPQGDFTHSSYGFYCVSGYAVVSVTDKTYMVAEGQQLIFDFDRNEACPITIMGEGRVIIAEILYSVAEHVAEEIPEEKATFDDFKAAFKVSRSRQKWRRALAKNSDVWYDEALQRKIDFLDRTYIDLITWVVVTVLLCLLMFIGVSHSVIIGLIAVWTVVFWLVVSPLICMLVLPKPINAHIKRVEEMTEYEMKLYLKSAGKNAQLDKLLNKYKYSGTDGWDEEYRSIFERIKTNDRK